MGDASEGVSPREIRELLDEARRLRSGEGVSEAEWAAYYVRKRAVTARIAAYDAARERGEGR